MSHGQVPANLEVSEIQYNVVRPVVADGGIVPLQSANTRGDLSVAEQFQPLPEDNALQVFWTSPRFPTVADPVTPIIRTNSAALATNLVAKASPGRFLRTTVVADAAAIAGWVMVMNAVSAAAAAGGTPIQRQPILAGVVGNVTIDVSALGGLPCSAGIVVCVSSTQHILTLMGAATWTFDNVVT